MIFFVNRFTIEAFGLAVAVREFASVLDRPLLAAHQVDSNLLKQGNLKPVSKLHALGLRGQAWHLNDLFAPYCIVMTLIGLLTGRNVILCPHGMLDRWAMRQSRFRAKLAVLALFNFCARFGRLSIHALTPAEQRKAQFFLPNARRNEIVPNGVPSDIMALQKELFTPGPPARSGPIVVGSFSRISPKKNQLAMVDLAVALRDTRPQVFENMRFCIDGQVEDQTYMDQIEQAVDAAGLTAKFSFSGPVAFEQRGKVLSEYDLFFFPSLSEGMPYVLLEAMALGVRPIVAHTAAGGFAAPYGAVIYHELAQAVKAMPQDRAALASMPLNRVGFLEEYGDARLRRFMALFEEVA
ncbi:MAG: glycosyltransferase [Pelagimonas sp.]|nr:glycosyltransferase [Pelagimonas sp.]